MHAIQSASHVGFYLDAWMQVGSCGLVAQSSDAGEIKIDTQSPAALGMKKSEAFRFDMSGCRQLT